MIYVLSIFAFVVLSSQELLAEATLDAPKNRQLGREKLINVSKQKLNCTSQSLNNYRNTDFKSAMDERKYQSAADSLQKYLDENDCYSALVLQDVSKIKKQEALNTYLWALSDIAFAHLKAQQFAKCIEVTKRTLTEYYKAPLVYSKSKKVRSAFKTNLERCEKGRFADLELKKIPVQSCPFKLNGVTVEITGLGESIEMRRSFQIGNMRQSILIDDKKTCLAIVDISVDPELLA